MTKPTHIPPQIKTPTDTSVLRPTTDMVLLSVQSDREVLKGAHCLQIALELVFVYFFSAQYNNLQSILVLKTRFSFSPSHTPFLVESSQQSRYLCVLTCRSHYSAYGSEEIDVTASSYLPIYKLPIKLHCSKRLTHDAKVHFCCDL